MRTIVKQEIFYKTLSCSVYHFRKSQYLKTSVLSIDLLRMLYQRSRETLVCPFHMAFWRSSDFRWHGVCNAFLIDLPKNTTTAHSMAGVSVSQYLGDMFYFTKFTLERESWTYTCPMYTSQYLCPKNSICGISDLALNGLFTSEDTE